MAESKSCPQCGRPVPGDVPQGLCPACLLKRGLEANTVGYTDQAQARAKWTPPAVEQLAPLFPELEVLELIGRGGMGAVYKARQKELDRFVALKILPPEIARDEAFAQRFAREAQAMAKLGHPNIVMIHDFGRRGEFYFFLMEYVEGLSLRQLLDSGGVASKEALAIVPQICDALQFAHDRGIVHRDIKPENILLSRSGQVKIADFGLAKLIGRVEGVSPSCPAAVSATEDASDKQQNKDRGRDAHGTRGQDALVTESVMGTPHYMAPEQVERPGEVDHRADIYSLGVVFYQMLTGELPGKDFQPPSRKVLIDVRLDEVVLRALERQPELRYQQASEIKTQVETIVTSPGTIGVRPVQGADRQRQASYEQRAPGWVIRCLKCGFTEPWGKYGIRLGGAGRKWTLGWCSRCRWVRCHVIEHRESAGRATALHAEGELPPGADELLRMDDIRRSVRGPGMALLVVGALQLGWLLVAIIAAMTSSPAVHVEDFALPYALVGSLFFPVAGVFVIVSASRMRQLRGYGAARAASILSIVTGLGNPLSLAAGIWALVVLSRREVKEAFASTDASTIASTPSVAPGGVRGKPRLWLAVVLCPSGFVWLAVWAVILHLHDGPGRVYIDLGGFAIIEAAAMLMSVRAWRQRGAKILTFTSALLVAGTLAMGAAICVDDSRATRIYDVHGQVTDAVTGRPISGALVIDSLWLSEAHEAYTNAGGYFIIRSHENMLVASAPGYLRWLKRIDRSRLMGFDSERQINFSLHPVAHRGEEKSRLAALRRQLEEQWQQVDQATSSKKSTLYPREILDRMAMGIIKVQELIEAERAVSQDVGRTTALHAESQPATVRPGSPQTQGAGSRLEFRIAPYAAKSGQKPAIDAAVEQTYRQWLAQGRVGRWWKSPEELPVGLPRLLWLPLKDSESRDPTTVTGEWGGRTYLLVSDEPNAIMLPPSAGGPEWGIFGVGTATDERNGPAIEAELDEAGAELLHSLTSSAWNEHLATIVDGKVTSAPIVRVPLRERVKIMGRFTKQEATDLSSSLLNGMPRSASSVRAGTFGPIIEQTVTAEPKCVIDLDTGKVLTPPEELLGQDMEPFMRWVRAQGADIAWNGNKASPGLVGFDLVAMPIQPSFLETANRLPLLDATANATAGNPVFLVAKELPTVFIIKTRENGIGLLQIVGFNDNPRATRIRYKLLRRTESARDVAGGDAAEVPLRGIVRNETGTPVAANIWLLPAGTRARAGAQGEFAIPCEIASPQAIVAWDKEKNLSGLARMDSGPPESVEIILRPAITFTGRVTDSAGEPVRGAQVRVGIRGSVPFFGQVATGADGRYTMKYIPAGPDYEFSMVAQGYELRKDVVFPSKDAAGKTVTQDFSALTKAGMSAGDTAGSGRLRGASQPATVRPGSSQTQPAGGLATPGN